MKSHNIITIKYTDNTVSIEFSHDENKFCLNHPISPTSVIGGADGGISFFLTKNVDTNLKSILLKEHKIEITIFDWKNRKLIRLSAYAYNDQKDINSLMNALQAII